MSANLADHLAPASTPQTERLPGEAGKRQVKNNAGGFVFPVDKWTRLERFLILGSEGGSYYAEERALTVENAKAVTECADEDFQRTLNTIVEISDSGRAPKNDYALLCLAILSARKVEGVLALSKLRDVARMGGDFLLFVNMVTKLRGKGRALLSALRHWYTERDAKDVAFQATKYANRNGWSHKDVLRLCKPNVSGDHDGVFAHIVGKPWHDRLSEDSAAGCYLRSVEAAKSASSAKDVIALIRDHNLPREVIPTEFLNDVGVWDALLDRMPMRAMVRSLGKMSNVGLLKPLSDGANRVVSKLADVEYIRKSRMHPLGVMLALKTYGQGHGVNGKLTWDVDSRIVDALDGAFYNAFANVEPSGKKFLLGLDVSGSMTAALTQKRLETDKKTGKTRVKTIPLPMNCREAAAVMAAVTVRTEPVTHVLAFSAKGGQSYWKSGVIEFPISKSDSFRDIDRSMAGMPFARTDCSLPITTAMEKGWDVDTFAVYTDNETYAGDVHPSVALQDYRRKHNAEAKMVVCGMVSNGFTIADPDDAGMLDVVGFDTNAPALISDFSR